MKNFHLNKSEVFCMFPFLGYRNLHGYYSPCPIYWRNNTFFSEKNKISNQDPEHFLNNEELKQLRKDMIEGNKDSSLINDVCRICQEHRNKGMSCLRNAGNTFLSKFYDQVISNLNEDYSLKDTKVLFSSFTNNNICNFECLMCDKERSSSFLTKKDSKLNKFLNPHILERKKIYDDNFNVFRTSEFIYFGYSGEPFITPDHLYILDRLVKEDLVNKTIIYHTNCSYVDDKILKTLKQFKKIIILASIDGISDFHKIIRPSKVKWSTIEKNIRQFNSLDNLEFNVYASISVLNAFHIIEMYDYFVKNNFIKQNNFILNPVYNFLTLGNLNTNIKERLKSYYNDFINKTTLSNNELNFHNNSILDEFKRILTFLDKQPEQDTKLLQQQLLKIYENNKKFFIKNYSYLLEKFK